MKVEGINVDIFERYLTTNNVYDDDITSKASLFTEDANLIKDHNDLFRFLNYNEQYIFPAIDKNIPVIFYNFSIWTMSKSRANVFVKGPSLKTFLGKLTTSYQPGTESIYVRKQLYLNDKNTESVVFNKLLGLGCRYDETTNLIILHELGHAIHHQLSKQSGNLLDETTTEAIFLNKLITFTDFAHNRNIDIPEISPVAYKAVTEGYADLYSCIVIDKLYSKERATKIIEALHQMRLSAYEDVEDVKKELYYSFDSIKHYIDNRNSLYFREFDDIHKYISDIVSKVAIHYINKETGSFNNRSHCNFLGVINVAHNINADEAYAAGLVIQKRFPFINLYAKRIKNDLEQFDIGCKVGKAWIKTLSKLDLKNKIKDIKRSVSIKDSESMQGNADKHKPK